MIFFLFSSLYSHKANKVPQGKPPIQKSLSHGGVSLRQAWLKKPVRLNKICRGIAFGSYGDVTRPPPPLHWKYFLRYLIQIVSLDKVYQYYSLPEI